MNEEKRIKRLKWLSLTLAVAFAISLGWGIYENRLVNEYKTAADNQYKRAFNDLVTSLNEVETSMAKAKVANSSSLKTMYLGETWRGSLSAVSNLGQLPADEVGISYVDSVINQVGDLDRKSVV